MRLVDLVKMGTQELRSLALKGELRPRHLWTAVLGASKYREALAKGDIANPHDGQLRAVACILCPSHQVRKITVAGRQVEAVYCGKPLDPRMDTALPTCGCPVAITILGVTRPASKALVRSERCPQEWWPEPGVPGTLEDLEQAE